jgi:hypothetical protein
MDTEKFQCANCNAQLLTADSVCAQCDEKLREPNASLLKGKHTCPACEFKFDQAEVFLWPERAKWYVPQWHHSRCPHCKVKLRDKKNFKFSFLEKALLICAYIGIPFIADRDIRLMLLAGIGIFLLMTFCIRTEWTVPNESRFARDDSLPRV